MTYCDQVREHGFAVLPGLIADATLNALASALTGLERDDSAVRTRGASRATYAVRNLLTLLPVVRTIAESPPLSDIGTGVLGAGSFPVRRLLFDKTPEA